VLARTFVVAVTVVVLGGGAARAQRPAPAPGPAAGAAEATVPDDPRFPAVIQAPPGFDPDPAWTEYDGAFRDAAAGDVEVAKARLRRLAASWPGHPAQARAASLMQELRRRRDAPDAVSKVARSELAFWSTLGGASLALNVCVMIDCQTDREWAGVFTLSMGGALAAALLATRDGVRQGEAQLYNSAQTWGAWNALLINDGLADTKEQAGISIAMQAGGLAAGVGLWQTWRPTQGDVALTNTFLLWGSVLTLWGHLALDEEPELRTVVAAGDVALLAGALVSTQVKMSRGRTLLIDIGGVLGTLAGGLLAIAAEPDSGSDSAVGTAMLLGTAAGLGLAVVGTRSWDQPPPVQVQLAPTVLEGPSRTKGYGVTAGFSF
jgi:hypothetical protein